MGLTVGFCTFLVFIHSAPWRVMPEIRQNYLICPCCSKKSFTMLITLVLPVPAGPNMNILNGLFWGQRLCSVIVLKACNCSGFNVHLCPKSSMSIVGANSLLFDWRWIDGVNMVSDCKLIAVWKSLPSLMVVVVYEGDGVSAWFIMVAFCFHWSCQLS